MNKELTDCVNLMQVMLAIAPLKMVFGDLCVSGNCWEIFKKSNPDCTIADIELHIKLQYAK